MPTPAERSALAFFSAVIVLGGATRLYRRHAENPVVNAGTSSALHRQIGAVDSAAATRKRGNKAGKRIRPKKGAPSDPPATPVLVDLDIAPADQIETLRGVGPALAARIAADRDSLGPFGTLEGLERVRGIGPGLAGKLAKHVTFSGVPRPVNTVVSMRSVNRAPRRKSRRREQIY